MYKKYPFRLIVAGLLGISLLMLYMLGIDRYITLELVQRYIETLQQFVSDHYILSVMCYITTMIGATIATIPITILLTVLAGFLFGPWYGTVYTILGATLGAIVLFIVTRYLVGEFVQHRYQNELRVFNKEIDRHGHRYLLIVQLLPLTPTFLVNVFSGLTTLSLWSFIWTTVAGMFPGAFVYAWIGQQLPQLVSLKILFSMPTLLTLLVLLLIIILMVFSWGRYPFFIVMKKVHRDKHMQ